MKKLSGISTVLAFSLFAVSGAVAQNSGNVISLGQGPSVKGVPLNTKSFSPQIAKAVGRINAEKRHESAREYTPGASNNLFAGGLLSTSRVSTMGGKYFPGISATSFEPPDPDLAVGPNHIVEVVNSDIAFMSKQGQITFQQSGQQFFSSISPEAFDFDPKVIYDQVSKRFVVLDLGQDDGAKTSSLLIAVSDDENPAGNWNLFKVDVKQTVGSDELWLDYPGFGYSKDTIAVTGNMFGFTNGFNGTQIIAFNKSTLYGGTATPNKFSLPSSFTVQLAKTYDPTTSTVYGAEWDSGTSLNLIAVKNTTGTFSVSETKVTIPQWVPDQGFVTGPGGVSVQTNDPRILVAASRNDRFVCSHSIGISSGDRRSAARWYDIKLNQWPAGAGLPALTQSGTVVPPTGHSYTFPAVSIDAGGNIGMTFSKIGTTTPGDVMGCGRKASDPLGTMGAPIVLDKSIGATYNGFTSRWGDYFDLELDPADNRTFWAVGMGAGRNNGRWQTFIRSFIIQVPDAELSQILPQAVTVSNGTLVFGDRISLFNSDSNIYSIRSEAVRGLGQVAAFNAVYRVPFSNIDVLKIALKLAGPTGTTAVVFARSVSTGEYIQIGTTGLSTAGVDKTFTLTPAQIAQFVNSNGEVSVIVRSILPVRAGRMPGAYTFGTDKGILIGAPKASE